MKNADETEDVNAAVKAAILSEVKGLLEDHLPTIRKDAVEAFQAAEDQEKPVAKFGFSVAYPPEDPKPEVEISIQWTVRRKATSTHVVDPNQTTFPI